MIKKWNEFIREFVEDNANSLVDAKMEELRDLIGQERNAYNEEKLKNEELVNTMIKN